MLNPSFSSWIILVLLGKRCQYDKLQMKDLTLSLQWASLLDTTSHMPLLVTSTGQECSGWLPGKESWKLGMVSSRLHSITPLPFIGFAAINLIWEYKYLLNPMSSPRLWSSELSSTLRETQHVYLSIFPLIPYDFAFCVQVFDLKFSFSIWRNVGNLNFSEVNKSGPLWNKTKKIFKAQEHTVQLLIRNSHIATTQAQEEKKKCVLKCD